MTSLGRCLLFHLKYPAEMERLYEAEEPKIEGLANSDRVLEKIRAVGDEANREAAAFLEYCAAGIEKHFGCFCAARRKRSNLEKTWQLEYQVSLKRAPKKRFWIGVSIDTYKTALIPWLWCRGGRSARDEVIHLLGRGNRSSTSDWGTGTVALGEVTIPVPQDLDEPVFSEPLVAQVHLALNALSAQEVKGILSIVGNRY